MTARTRSALTPLVLVLLAAVLAYAISLIPTLGLAHGATAAGVVEVAAPVAVPQIAPTPAPLPEPTIDEIGMLWRRGEFIGAGIMVVFGLLSIAIRADRKRALYYTAGLTAIGGCVDLVANGHTPSVGMIVGAAAVFVALVTRSPLPPRYPEAIARTPERGSALLGLLAPLAACALIVAAAGHLWSCAGTAKATATDVGTCSAAQAGPLVDDVQQLLTDNTDEAGHVDWQRVEDGLRARLAAAGREVLACATRRAIDRMLEPGLTRTADRADMERGWARLRDGVLATPAMPAR